MYCKVFLFVNLNRPCEVRAGLFLLEQFGQAFQVYLCASELACIYGRIAHQAPVVTHIVGYAALGSYLVAVADGDMSGKAYLASYHVEISDLC